MHRFDTKRHAVKMKVEILTVNGLRSRFLKKKNPDKHALYKDQQKTYA